MISIGIGDTVRVVRDVDGDGRGLNLKGMLGEVADVLGARAPGRDVARYVVAFSNPCGDNLAREYNLAESEIERVSAAELRAIEAAS